MEKDLEWFEEAFGNVMSSDVLLMDGLMRYVGSGRGKLLRPRLVLLSARMFGEVNDATRRTALFVEMLHTATLIHDDVVDGSDTRRGRASLNAHYDSRSAVLAGDYLLAKAMTLLSDPSDNQILKEMLNVAMAMSEGELLQSEELGVRSEELYIDIITRKTAHLIRACCVGGALSVTPNFQFSTLTRSASLRATPFNFQFISDFGLNLGLVFQMRDDILDDDDSETTVLAKQLLPEYLEKTLKALDALTPYVINKEAQDSLRELTVFCAERDH